MALDAKSALNQRVTPLQEQREFVLAVQGRLDEAERYLRQVVDDNLRVRQMCETDTQYARLTNATLSHTLSLSGHCRDPMSASTKPR